MAPSCFDLLSSACLNEGIDWMMEADQFLPIYLLFCEYLCMVYMWVQPHTRDGGQGSEVNLLKGSSRLPPCSLREGLSE